MNIAVIVAVTIAVIVIILVLYKYNKEMLINIAYQACTNAEVALGSGKGTEKYIRAVNFISSKLPKWSKLFITDETLKYVIEKMALPTLQKIFKKK